METVKKGKKTTANKVVKKRKPSVKNKQSKVVLESYPAENSFSFGRMLIFIFKVITLPLYMVYVLLFKIPTDGPAPIVGLLRFSFFVTLSILMTNSHKFQHFIDNFVSSHNWIPISSATILGIISIIMLLNLLLSFLEIFGFSTGSYWYDPYESASKNSYSGYDAIEEGLNYRDSLLRAKNTTGKIQELKKTGFITKERLFSLSSSSEVNEALTLLNSQMRAMHNHDKLKTLESMFGGK